MHRPVSRLRRLFLNPSWKHRAHIEAHSKYTCHTCTPRDYFSASERSWESTVLGRARSATRTRCEQGWIDAQIFERNHPGKHRVCWLRVRPRPVRPEDCAMQVEKSAAGALCSGQRRLVELSTTEDKVEEREGAWTYIGALAGLALA